MELRQLRYFLTLAEELHFGRAAARERIVQSALSQQLQRLERELGVRLLERSTHHVRLTPAGARLEGEARKILAHVERAVAAARDAARPIPTLRIGVTDTGYDAVAQVLHRVRTDRPKLEIHEVQAGVPDQLRMIADGHLDLGFGRAWTLPADMSAEVFRLDRLGVVFPREHRLAVEPVISVACLATEVLLLANERRAPEYNAFLADLCGTAGFTPAVYPGTVDSVRAAVDLVARRLCVACLPASARPASPSVVWRPLVEPDSRYPWSVLLRSGSHGDEPVRTVIEAVRASSLEQGWLAVPR